MAGFVIESLRNRPTFILEEPIVNLLMDRFEFQQDVDLSNLVDVIAESDWARNIADGVARRGGLKPGTPEYEKFVQTYSRYIAAGFARSIVRRLGRPPEILVTAEEWEAPERRRRRTGRAAERGE